MCHNKIKLTYVTQQDKLKFVSYKIKLKVTNVLNLSFVYPQYKIKFVTYKIIVCIKFYTYKKF